MGRNRGANIKLTIALLLAFLAGTAVGGLAWEQLSPVIKLRSLKSAELGMVADFAPGSVTLIRRQAFPRRLAQQQGRDATRLWAGITEDTPLPVRLWLGRSEESQFVAFYAVDPLRGCVIPWREDTGQFVDPCGGAHYARNGSCVAGPCERGLDRFPVQVKNGKVYANLATLILGPPRQR